MKKVLLILSICITTVFIIGEVIGRYNGLTTFPLFVKDPDFEYISSPNQNVYVYRNHFVTNQFSQRSNILSKKDTIVYLLIGDSVIFGGNSIDQDSLVSTRLENLIKLRTDKNVRVLNISSKSWGPDNAAAYLKKYGTFGASKIILTVSSHDAHDNMTFKDIVGKDESHPDKNPTLAWSRLFAKGWPIILSKLTNTKIKIDTSGLMQSPSFNSGFASIHKLTDSLQIPFFIYLHKTTPEIQQANLEIGGKEIQVFCKKNKIKLIDLNERVSMYEDYIHFGNRGHKFLSDKFYDILVNNN